MKRHLLNRGFTLIEIMIVVTIISILASMSIVGATSIQRSTRDDARSSRTTVIAEALEKYYDDNNEYPSVAAITGQPISTVKQKLAVKDDDALVFPNATSTALSVLVGSTPSPTRLVYAGATTDTNANTQCQSDVNGYCDAFQLQYLKEVDNVPVTIKSRQNGVLAVSGPDTPIVLSPPTQPAVVGSKISSTLVRFTASSASCSVGSVEYKIRYNTSSTLPDWSTVSWSSATTKDINPGSNTTYYSQSLARCVSGVDASADSSPSSVDLLDFTPAPPAGTPPGPVTVSASSVASSSLTVSWNNASGSAPITYYVSYTPQSGSNVAAPGCSNTTSTSCNINGLAANTSYTIYVNAVNSAGSSQGYTVVTTGSTGSPPSTPVVNASPASSTSIQVSWSASGGTSPINYTVRYGTSSAGTVASGCSGISGTSCTISGLTHATLYQISVTASNSYGSAVGSSSATTANATLTVNNPTMNGYGNANINFTVSGLGGAAASTSAGYIISGVSGCGTITVTGNGTGNCAVSFDPCNTDKSFTVAGNSLSGSGQVSRRPTDAPTINVSGSTVSGKSVVANWSYGGPITYVSMRYLGTHANGVSFQGSIADIAEGSGGSGSSTVGPFASGDQVQVKVYAANCLYKAKDAYTGYGANYIQANWDITTVKNIP